MPRNGVIAIRFSQFSRNRVVSQLVSDCEKRPSPTLSKTVLIDAKKIKKLEIAVKKVAWRRSCYKQNVKYVRLNEHLHCQFPSGVFVEFVFRRDAAHNGRRAQNARSLGNPDLGIRFVQRRAHFKWGFRERSRSMVERWFGGGVVGDRGAYGFRRDAIIAVSARCHCGRRRVYAVV